MISTNSIGIILVFYVILSFYVSSINILIIIWFQIYDYNISTLPLIIEVFNFLRVLPKLTMRLFYLLDMSRDRDLKFNSSHLQHCFHQI